MPDIDLSRMREWLTVPEARLVESTSGPALTSLSTTELRRKIARVRTLRDKWRDVYMRQRRTAQKARTSRASAANQRSREKSELFADALGRLEAQLEKAAALAGAAAIRTAARPGRSTRTREHRQTRSGTKRTLAGQVAERRSDHVRSAQAALPPMQTRKTARKTASPRRKTKTAAAAMRPTNPAAGSARPRKRAQADPQSRTAATRYQGKMGGLTTRIHGHVSSRGKRSQARRDQRG